MRATQPHHPEQPVFRFHSFTLLCPSLTTKRGPLANVSLWRTPFFFPSFLLGWLNCRATRIGREENEKYTTVLLANIFIHQSQRNTVKRKDKNKTNNMKKKRVETTKVAVSVILLYDLHPSWSWITPEEKKNSSNLTKRKTDNFQKIISSAQKKKSIEIV